MKIKHIALALSATFIVTSTTTLAATSKDVSLYSVSSAGVGESIGRVTLQQTDYGVEITPHLHDLTPGLHGFHLHAKGSCKAAEKGGKMTAAAAAGGHYDPEESGHHGKPWGNGHLGDLPALYVDAQGAASHPVLAPRLKMDDFSGKAIMIHAGGDNYSDQPKALGGGGARVACGVVLK